MRLLHTTRLTFGEWHGIATEPYAILSHCWNHAPGMEEITYQQLSSGADLSDLPGWRKVLRCCQIASSRGINWVWIDSCCLDKTNNTELSETINSMFSYYHQSAECYVFLDETPPRDGIHGSRDNAGARQNVPRLSDLSRKRWFTRGWTLQELLAPSSVIFFDHSSEPIGSRTELASKIWSVTGIDSEYLTKRKDIREASIAQRMSWASRRKTTRVEDVAYSLLGLFDVNIPLLYGEGRRKAFQRLQLAIIAQSDDESIFAWGIGETFTTPTGMLADSPGDFSGSEGVERHHNPRAKTNTAFQGTLRGISFRYTPRISETILAPPYQHLNMLKRIRLACQLVEDGSAIDIKIKFHRGRFWRFGLEISEQSRVVDIMRDVLGGEKTVFVAASRDNFEYSAPNFEEKNMWMKAADLPPHELLQWPARWILSNAILLYWFFFGFDSEMNVIALFLVLMLVNDIRLSGLTAALLILIVLPAIAVRWSRDLS